MKNKVIVSIILVAIVITAGGIFHAKRSGDDKVNIKLPESPEEFRDFADSNEFKALDREQRRKIMRTAMQKQMDKTLNEYFSLPEKDRTAYLDDVIDRFEQMRRQWARDRQQRQDDRPRESRQMRTPNPEQMRQRMESIDPETMAKMTEFMMAMQKRRKERGLSTGFGR